jgi:PAS domain S-box-containing protein
MTWSRKPSIKRRVTTVIMRASIAVLLVTVTAFMIYDLVTFRQTMAQNLVTQARTIADNSTAAVAFKNENDAANVLSSLRSDPHIIAAAIYDAQGKLFVKYPASIPDADLPAAPQSRDYKFGKSHLILFQPVVQSGKPLGTLYLRSDLTALSQRLQLYGAISLLIMAGSLLVAFLLSNVLQRRISDPIIALTETIQKISQQHNYSLRAPKLSDDELGLLTDSFNNMLERIQSSDSALRASEEQLRIVADHASVFLCQFDRDHRYKFANRAYAERYGFAPPQLIGKSLSEVLGTAAYELIRPHIYKAFTGKKIEFEMELPYATLGSRWIYVVFMPERNVEGQVVGIVAVVNDISLRKREEQELERARDEALNASRAKDDFLAALSHELRTPLNPVLLVASDAANNPQLPDETRADFEMIRRNVELEARLIDDLLDLTRISRGKLSLEKRPLDVRSVLQDAIAIVQSDAKIKQIGLTLDFGADQFMVLGDAVRLQQIFWNVLKNAVKFTPEGGKITVETRTLAENGNIAVKIIDTGIGLTIGEIVHIFNAFSQGDHADTSGSHKFGGLGLGLAISRMLVELHSGVIHAASAGRDQGATFTIELPIVQVEERNGSSAPPERPATNNSHTALKKKSGGRILLVEDHEPTRAALSRLLTRRDYKVMTATSVAEARTLARREKFDLVVSDIGLPDGNGYTLMSELRDEFGLKGIALTGYGMEQDVLRGQNAGFVAHLTKPVRIEALEKALGDAG